MRGPGVRIQNDVRRLWRCPACSRERKVPATQTTVLCSCRQPAPQMQLIEGKRYAKPTPPELDLVMTEEDCGPEEAAVPEPADRGGHKPQREKKPQSPHSEMTADGAGADVNPASGPSVDAAKELPPET